MEEQILVDEILETATEMNPFYEPADMDVIISAVSHNFFIIVAVILGVYPFLYLMQRLISYCQKAFDAEGLRKLEGGGLWSRLPDGSLYNGLDKIANVRFAEKLWRRGR